MIIFFILLITLLFILFTKIKIKFFLILKNLEYDYKAEIFVCKLKLKTIDKNEIEKIINKLKLKRKNKKQSKIEIFKILKKIKIEELNLDLKLGLYHLFPTIFSIPITSTIIAIILSKIKTKQSKINYRIKPVYNKLTVQAQGNFIIVFRIIDLLLFTSDVKVSL